MKRVFTLPWVPLGDYTLPHCYKHLPTQFLKLSICKQLYVWNHSLSLSFSFSMYLVYLAEHGQCLKVQVRADQCCNGAKDIRPSLVNDSSISCTQHSPAWHCGSWGKGRCCFSNHLLFPAIFLSPHPWGRFHNSDRLSVRVQELPECFLFIWWQDTEISTVHWKRKYWRLARQITSGWQHME